MYILIFMKTTSFQQKSKHKADPYIFNHVITYIAILRLVYIQLL